jgi:hypothetical protein
LREIVKGERGREARTRRKKVSLKRERGGWLMKG